MYDVVLLFDTLDQYEFMSGRAKEVNQYQIEVSCQANKHFMASDMQIHLNILQKTRILESIMYFNYRYHGDERLLPEYNPSMSDDVTVVSDDNDAYSESISQAEVFPDYFGNDLKSDPEKNSRAMYLATLKLNKVRPEQKGVYKCGPSNTRSASVELHITDGT